MSEISFCDPCHTFLRGSWTKLSEHHFAIQYEHHRNAESFQYALEMGCAICLRLWAAFRRGYDDDSQGYKESNARAPRPCPPSPTIFEHPVYRDNCSIVYFRHSELLYYARFELSSHYKPPAHIETASSSTGDDVALDFLLAQYRQCIEHHAMCSKPVPSHNFHPTRLIDVGTYSDALVHLCERESLPTGARYISLSHCWGNVRPTTLTKSSAACLKKGIPITSLPRTFQDAVAVTRTFRHRYLWIDSLYAHHNYPASLYH
jgi:hypothetical protein